MRVASTAIIARIARPVSGKDDAEGDDAGDGDDEGASYNGADLYARLPREGRLRTLLREVPARARRDGISLGRTIRGRLLVPFLPARLRRLVLRRHGRLLLSDAWRARARVLNPAILDAVSRRRMLQVLQDDTPADRVRAFCNHHIPSRCTYSAIAAARQGPAVSLPLLDRRVVDFALSLPISHVLADGLSRQPFRIAMEGILPDRVQLSRHKVGRSGDWITRSAAAKPALLAALEQLRAKPPPAVSALFDLDAIGEGLALVPEPDEALQRMRSRADEARPWRRQALTAVTCLNVACHLAQRPAPGPAPLR
jgi:asparagine synthase (glutamine-hydrolysing)